MPPCWTAITCTRANINKMAAGHALDDNDRAPWLAALNDAIFAMQRTNPVSLLVCSALKKSYRDRLREGNRNLHFLYLKGDKTVIEERLKQRKGHFFKPQMLVSQFATLEEPGEQEPDIAGDRHQPAAGRRGRRHARLHQPSPPASAGRRRPSRRLQLM